MANPIQPVAQIPAAVVNPSTVPRSLIILPAPKNPIPLMTCAPKRPKSNLIACIASG